MRGLMYEPISIMPASAGWRAYYRQDDGTVLSDLVTMWAICRVVDWFDLTPLTRWDDKLKKHVTYNRGEFRPDKEHINAVRGLIATEIGLEDAEEAYNFCGYWNPIDEPELPSWITGEQKPEQQEA